MWQLRFWKKAMKTMKRMKMNNKANEILTQSLIADSKNFNLRIANLEKDFSDLQKVVYSIVVAIRNSVTPTEEDAEKTETK